MVVSIGIRKTTNRFLGPEVRVKQPATVLGMAILSASVTNERGVRGVGRRVGGKTKRRRGSPRRRSSWGRCGGAGGKAQTRLSRVNRTWIGVQHGGGHGATMCVSMSIRARNVERRRNGGHRRRRSRDEVLGSMNGGFEFIREKMLTNRSKGGTIGASAEGLFDRIISRGEPSYKTVCEANIRNVNTDGRKLLSQVLQMSQPVCHRLIIALSCSAKRLLQTHDVWSRVGSKAGSEDIPRLLPGPSGTEKTGLLRLTIQMQNSQDMALHFSPPGGLRKFVGLGLINIIVPQGQ